MKTFLDDNFLLDSDVAVDLYHGYAKDLPIIDYHCHLPPRADRERPPLRNLTQIWLDGDHYKWRAMRTNGVAERYCTGDATDWEKFEAWAATVPDALRNPLYHWTHLELSRPFGITTAACRRRRRGRSATAATSVLREDGFTTRGILRRCKVAVVCTTDDPADSLEPTAGWRSAPIPRRGSARRGGPTGRSAVADPDGVQRVGGASRSGRRRGHRREPRPRSWRRSRCGTRSSTRWAAELSDHGLETVVAEPWYRRGRGARRSSACAPGRRSRPATRAASSRRCCIEFALLDHARGWTQQFHVGALRNNNTRLSPARSVPIRDSIRSATSSRPPAVALPRPPGPDRSAREDDPLQPQSAATTTLLATMIGQLPGRERAGQDAIRHGLVVPGSDGRHGARRSTPCRTWACCRRFVGHGHRLALVPRPTRGTSTSAACCATCSAKTFAGDASRTTAALSGTSSRVSASSTRGTTSGSRWARPRPVTPLEAECAAYLSPSWSSVRWRSPAAPRVRGVDRMPTRLSMAGPLRVDRPASNIERGCYRASRVRACA